MDTKNGVLLMPLVSPRRPAKQPSNSGKWLFVLTLAGLAAGFSIGLCCGYFASSNSTTRTAHYLTAPQPRHPVFEEVDIVAQPLVQTPEAALQAIEEAAVDAVPASAAAAAAAAAVLRAPALVGHDLSALPPLDLYHIPATGSTQYHGKYFSRTGQDDLVDELLNMQQGGFFVESGAYNGVDLSNTLFLEATRGWTGLLVEANPQLFADIVCNSNRTQSAAINACVSPSAQSQVLPLGAAGPLSGLVQHMSEPHLQHIHSDVQQGQDWVTRGSAASSQDGVAVDDMYVPCWPLHSLLEPLGRKTVDYWSLGTEGSQADILRATDFSKVHVRIITVEVTNAAAQRAVMDAMADKPYDLLIKLDFDLVFVKRGEFGAGKLQQIVDFNPSNEGYYTTPGNGPRVVNDFQYDGSEAVQMNGERLGAEQEGWPEEWYGPGVAEQAWPGDAQGYREWGGQEDSSSFMQDEWDVLPASAWQQ